MIYSERLLQLVLIAVFCLTLTAIGSEFAFSYRLQEDHAAFRLPDIPLSEVGWISQDSTNNFHFGPKAGKVEYRSLDGRLCSYFMAVRGSGAVVYRMNGSCERVVGKAGLSDRCGNDIQVRFEVWADRNILFRSETINKNSRPVEINALIPAETRKVKLLSVVQGNIGGGEVIWQDPGFILREYRPVVGECELFVPEELTGKCHVRILTPDGKDVSCRLYSGDISNPLLVEFDTSSLSDEYLAYVIVGADKEQNRGSWHGKGGLRLETRLVKKDKEKVLTHPGFIEAWNSDSTILAGCETVDSIHHSFPVVDMSEAAKASENFGSYFGLYIYTGYFKAMERGEYDFSTMSVWGSSIFIDDKFVVQWPGRHDFHEGRRCEYSGSVFLDEGVHKIEYLNYNKWPRQLTVCAWRKKGDNYRVLSGCDFMPSAKYRATEYISSADNSNDETFRWSVEDDMRFDINSPALVAVRFETVKNNSGKSYEYRWDMGDGIIAVGSEVEHVYLKKGQYRVTLTISEGGKIVAKATQLVNAGIDRAKLASDPRDVRLFDNVASRMYLEHVDIVSLQAFYDFACLIDNDRWQKLTADVIFSKSEQELVFADNISFYNKFASDMCGLLTGRYSEAISLMKSVLAGSGAANAALADLRLLYIRMLLDYSGDYQEADIQLEHLRTALSMDQIAKREILKAELQAGTGKLGTEEIINLPSGSMSDVTTRQLEQASVFRSAIAASQSEDKEVVQGGYEELMGVLLKTPSLVFDADFNLARLELLRSAGEYRQVYNIATRCSNMPMADVYEPKLLYFRVQSLLELGEKDTASDLVRRMEQKYPYCTETAEALRLVNVGN